MSSTVIKVHMGNLVVVTRLSRSDFLCHVNESCYIYIGTREKKPDEAILSIVLQWIQMLNTNVVTPFSSLYKLILKFSHHFQLSNSFFKHQYPTIAPYNSCNIIDYDSQFVKKIKDRTLCKIKIICGTRQKNPSFSLFTRKDKKAAWSISWFKNNNKVVEKTWSSAVLFFI